MSLERKPVVETVSYRVWKIGSPTLPDQFSVECLNCGHETGLWGTQRLAEQELIEVHLERIHPELALALIEARKRQGASIYRVLDSENDDDATDYEEDR